MDYERNMQTKINILYKAFDTPPITGATASELDVANQNELNVQKTFFHPQTAVTGMEKHDKNDAKYSKAQQAHKIALQQSPQRQQRTTTAATVGVNKSMQQDVPDDEESENVFETNENENLLGGQEQQQVAKNNAAVVRVNFKETPIATPDILHSYSQGDEAGNSTPLGSNQSFIPTTTTNAADFATTSTGASIERIGLETDCKLELHEFPKEMMQSQNNINEQYGSTIILTPTLLTPATHGQTAVNGGDDGSAFNDGVYKGPKLWQYLVKHYPITSQYLAILTIFIALWILGHILSPDYALPNTAIMRMILLIVGAQIAGVLVTFLKVPDMLGMLFFGVLYTNLGLADFSGYQKLEAFLREMALINIMLLAGLGLDASAFKKLWFMILRLTLIPTVAEVAIIAILAHFLLNMSWPWGILLGLVITAVSPNVVVTVMLKLKEERLGLNSGIHTLIYAMTTCNDVVAIFLFGVFCGIIFSTGSLTEQILQGPIGIGIGIVFGYVYGLMLKCVPSRNANYVNGLRFVLTILGGIVAVMGSKAIGYPSAGALGCVTVAFTAGTGWKHQEKKLTPQQLQAYENSQLNIEKKPISWLLWMPYNAVKRRYGVNIKSIGSKGNVGRRLDLMWTFLKPISFSLIGKEINFAILDAQIVGYGALLVLLGSAFRLAFAYLSTYGGNLTRKERGYITISGFPKATVQAALGPIALDLARSLNADSENLSLASNVLIISVLAIIFTAPLGAILMLRLAPLWLKHSPLNNDNLADDNGRGNADMADYNTTPNFLTNESAGSDNSDRNQF